VALGLFAGALTFYLGDLAIDRLGGEENQTPGYDSHVGQCVGTELSSRYHHPPKAKELLRPHKRRQAS